MNDKMKRISRNISRVFSGGTNGARKASDVSDIGGESAHEVSVDNSLENLQNRKNNSTISANSSNFVDVKLGDLQRSRSKNSRNSSGLRLKSARRSRNTGGRSRNTRWAKHLGEIGPEGGAMKAENRSIVTGEDGRDGKDGAHDGLDGTNSLGRATESSRTGSVGIKQSLSSRFARGRDEIKRKLKLMVRMRKRDGRRKSHVEKPERALRNNEGFTLKRSQTTSSVVFSKGWKKLKDTTARLAQNLKDMRDKRSHEGQSQGSVKMDPTTREAYRELKHYGHADSLDDAEAILEIMRKFQKSPEIQSLGCFYLSKIALQEGTGLVAYGVVDVLLKAMDKYVMNAKLQENACLLVWNLAIEDDNKRALTEKNVPTRVITAMKNFKEDTLVLHMACGAVKLLASEEEAKKTMADEGGIEMLLHSFHKFCRDEPNDAELQETCISCVQNFAHGKVFLPKLLEVKAPHMVIRSMIKFKYNNVVQSSACAAIWNMSIPEEYKMPLAELGAANRVIAAMKNFPDDCHVVLHAMGALKNLSNTPECFEYVRKKAHGGELGKVNIYDVIYDSFVIHQENDANIKRIGEDLLFSFDIEDEEDLNRDEGKVEDKKDLNDDHDLQDNQDNFDVAAARNAVRQNLSKKVNSQNDRNSGLDFDQSFGLGVVEDDDDLQKQFGVGNNDTLKSARSKESRKSQYDPQNPFDGLQATSQGDALEDEDELDFL